MMRLLLLILLLSITTARSAFTQKLTVNVAHSTSLAEALSNGRSEISPHQFITAGVHSKGYLFAVKPTGESVRWELTSGSIESIPLSKVGFEQTAPLFVSTGSESSLLVIIPKLFPNSGEFPIGIVRQVGPDGSVADLYQTQDGWIQAAGVSEDGVLIGLSIADRKRDNQSENIVLVIDRFGNELGEFSLGSETQAIRFTQTLSHVILYSQSRVGVFDLKSGERVAGTSIRSGIQYATYIPEDNTILAVGQKTVTLVHVENREIASVEIPASEQLSSSEGSVMESGTSYQSQRKVFLSDRFIPIQQPVRLRRVEEGEYEVTGLFGRILQISGRF